MTLGIQKVSNRSLNVRYEFQTFQLKEMEFSNDILGGWNDSYIQFSSKYYRIQLISQHWKLPHSQFINLKCILQHGIRNESNNGKLFGEFIYIARVHNARKKFFKWNGIHTNEWVSDRHEPKTEREWEKEAGGRHFENQYHYNRCCLIQYTRLNLLLICSSQLDMDFKVKKIKFI